MIFESLLGTDLRADSASGSGVSTMANPAGWLFDSFGMMPSEAGILVSERNAVGLSAVWTCVNIRAGLLASLPFNLYAQAANGTRKLALNRREHTILHDRTSPEDTSYQLRHKMAVNWLLWGNAYAEIETDGRGALRYLWPYHPTHVRVQYGNIRGEYHYVVTGQGPQGFVQHKVLPEDMLHLRGLCYEGVEGISVIQNYRRGLGLAMAREVFESNFVKNGAKMSGILQFPGRLTPEGKNNLQESFDKKFAGSQNAGRTILLEEGAKYIPTMMPLTDAEFIASKTMSRAEIAGLFRLPTMLVPGADDKAATYASSEIFNRQLVDYTLRDDVTMWQHEFSSKLFPDGDHFCEFDLNDLLRGDSVARAQYWLARWQTGSATANDICEAEGENRITEPSGDKYYIQSSYIDANAPLPAPAPAKLPAEPETKPEPKPGQTPADPGQSPPNRKPKPAKSGAMGAGFKLLFANLVGELRGWEKYLPARASTKLRALLIAPLAAELLGDGPYDEALEGFLANCSDALAQRVRELEPAQFDAELGRLEALILASTLMPEEERP